MKLYNSYSQKVEELKPIEPGKVSMYVCGPTVYNYPHVGNARPIVVFDTLKKALEAQGLEVTYVSNYTDVDDKIINTAIEQNVSEKEITDKYIKAYAQTRADLHADQPNVTHQNMEDLMVGARIDENTKKENPLDFTLWKATDKGIQWDTPWSKGRPGWHTECVVMIQDVFKKPLIDIHGGGLDLKFPHHENEIAQCEIVNHTHLANLWIHNGMINIDNKKMSKSIGNVRWAKDLIAQFGGNEIRWILISTHYRAPLNLNEETFQQAEKELTRIQTAYNQACVKLQMADAQDSYTVNEESWNAFIAALNDDLNTPNAISTIFELMKQLNQALRKRDIDTDLVGSLKTTMEKMLYILGIEFEPVVVSSEDKEMYKKWREAVKEKNFDVADQYRHTLQEKGIL